MLKKIFFLFTVFVSTQSYCQDGIFWKFDVHFKLKALDNTNPFRDSVIGIEFFVNESTSILQYNSNRKLLYDSITDKYYVALSYSGIGGSSEVANTQCPDIYIKVNFLSKQKNQGQYSKVVPIYFENAKGSSQSYDLGIIDLYEILGQALVKVNSNGIVEIINDYQPRHLTLLVKLD